MDLKKLYEWLLEQRIAYHNSTIDKKTEDFLVNIGFDWHHDVAIKTCYGCQKHSKKYKDEMLSDAIKYYGDLNDDELALKAIRTRSLNPDNDEQAWLIKVLSERIRLLREELKEQRIWKR